MLNPNPSTPATRNHRRTVCQSFRLPVICLLLGIVSIVLLLWTTRLSDRQGTAFNFVDALTDMEIQASTSHIWFEKIFYGQIDEDMRIVWESLDVALSLAAVMIDGGTSEYGLRLEPLEPSPLRDEMEQIKTLLLRLNEIAREQAAHPETAGIDSALEREYDATFVTFLKSAQNVEASREKALVSSQAELHRLCSVLLFAWTVVVVAATAGLFTRERRRKQAEEALMNSNELLQAQAAELRRHREHLIELVDERTSELSSANADLKREVVERSRAGEALRESRDRFERLSTEFHALLDAIPDALTLLSPDLNVVWANSGAASMFGKPITDLIGHPCHHLWNGTFAQGNDHPAVRAFRSGKGASIQAPAPDGSTRDTRVFPILDEERQVRSVIEIATDVTQKLTLQAEAQRVAHLASLGELAAGVAHEINNPVSGIINYAQVLIDLGRRTEEETEILDQIIREGDRVAAIVSSLLSFARETRTHKTLVDLNEVFSDVVALCGRQIEKDGILFSWHIPEALPPIFANHHQVQQVFLNLLSNARYALNQKYPASDPEKVLSVTVEQETHDGHPRVGVTFHDQGTGIPAELLDRVRDPFFSTKPKGYGTGLGLSISHGIVSDHGGRLLIRSVHGEYTSVTVILPAGDVYDDGKDTGH